MGMTLEVAEILQLIFQVDYLKKQIMIQKDALKKRERLAMMALLMRLFLNTTLMIG